MTDHPLYTTTLSGKARRGLALNGAAAALLTLVAGPQAFGGGHWLHGVIVCFTVPVAILALIIAGRARHPLMIFEDRVVLSALGRSVIPLSQVEAVAPGPKGRVGLVIRDPQTGGLADIPILWTLITQSQEDVIAEIEKARAR